MKLLRKAIRKLILESPEDDMFMEWWFDKKDRVPYRKWSRLDFTKHKEMLTKHPDESFEELGFVRPDEQQIKKLFKDKRVIKKYWNENCDRAFWQSGKVKFFHSLNYYEPDVPSDALMKGIATEGGMVNMSIKGFLQKYKLKNNKDEMSTYGIYDRQAPDDVDLEVLSLGVLIEGRVTFAHSKDAMVESRSKATPADYKTHKSSGMPKRMSPHYEYLQGLLFTEEDCRDKGVGECILDNWSVKAIVLEKGSMRKEQELGVHKLAAELGIDIVYSHEVF